MTYGELYREALREAHGETVTVCGYEYDTARALEELDPTAFRCGFNDWSDSACVCSNCGDSLDAEQDDEVTDLCEDCAADDDDGEEE